MPPFPMPKQRFAEIVFEIADLDTLEKRGLFANAKPILVGSTFQISPAHGLPSSDCLTSAFSAVTIRFDTTRVIAPVGTEYT